MNELMTSLCMVMPKPSDPTKKNLYRMADLDGLDLLPYTDGIDAIANKQILPHPSSQTLPDYMIGLFDWRIEEDNVDYMRIYTYITDRSWIEPIECEDVEPTAIIQKLRNGLEVMGCALDAKHDYLFHYHSPQNEDLALYVGADMINILFDKVFLKESVEAIAIYPIDLTQCKDCKRRFLTDKPRYYYMRLVFGEPNRYERVQTEQEDLSKIIIKHTKVFADNRNDAKKIRAFVSQLPMGSIIDEFSQLRNIERIEAEDIIEQYLSGAKQVLALENETGRMIQYLVESNAPLYVQLQEKAAQEWRISSKAERVEHEDVLASLKKEESELNTRKKVAQKELSRIDSHINKRNIELLKLDEMKRKSVDAIRHIMEKARDDAASFISEYAMFLPGTTVSGSNFGSETTEIPMVARKAMNVFTIENEASQPTDLKILLKHFVRNLEYAGVSERYSEEFSAYLCAAYANHANLLLCGQGGVNVMHAISASLCGHQPACLKLMDIPIDDVLDELNTYCGDLIWVPDTLSSQRFNDILRIMESFPEKMFILTTPFEETMAIEPHSLYRYVLPVFLSLMLDSIATVESLVYVDSSELDLKCEKLKWKECDELAAAIDIDKVVYSKIAMLGNWINQVKTGFEAERACIYAGLIPLSICTGKSIQLYDELRNVQSLKDREVDSLRSILRVVE